MFNDPQSPGSLLTVQVLATRDYHLVAEHMSGMCKALTPHLNKQSRLRLSKPRMEPGGCHSRMMPVRFVSGHS